MTTTYDPRHAAYLDEADVRGELSRVFDICDGCRLCVNFCGSFPSLFDLIGRRSAQALDPGGTGDEPARVERDAGRLSPSQQDLVIDECFQCKLCVAACPYSAASHEQPVDFPRLILRAQAMRYSNGQRRLQRGAPTRALVHTDLVGRIGAAFPSVSNRLISARPGSLVRRLVSRAAGVSTTHRLPRFAPRRFSSWFVERETRQDIRSGSASQAAVVIYPTCVIEYAETSIGQDLVEVFERSGVDCAVSQAGCCGAPWLHAGHARKFTELAAENLSKLAGEVRSGRDIVVPQPMCGWVLKQDYGLYVGGADAALVAAHTFDGSEYLLKLHNEEGTELDPKFPRSARAVTYRPSSHLTAQNIGPVGGDLVALTGASVSVAAEAPGDLGWWGLRAGNEQASSVVTKALTDSVDRVGRGVDTHGGSVAVGDCVFTNALFAQRAGAEVLHPLEFVARAYHAADLELDGL